MNRVRVDNVRGLEVVKARLGAIVDAARARGRLGEALDGRDVLGLFLGGEGAPACVSTLEGQRHCVYSPFLAHNGLGAAAAGRGGTENGLDGQRGGHEEGREMHLGGSSDGRSRVVASEEIVKSES